MTEPYADAAAFRQALEQRLRNAAKIAARGVLRERQVFVFERFLVRAFALPDMQLVVKGGMAIELRTQRARSTRDIDLRALGAPARFEELLAGIDQQESRDYLSFRIAPAAQPDIQAAGMKYPGRRYRVQAELAGKVYGDPFGVDVAFGEPVHGKPETVRGRSDLGFVDISPPECSIYPLVTHIAEKLHAYTVPRPSPNSRVKDLPDLAILASLGTLDADVLRTAVKQTFVHRSTHEVPHALDRPREQWRLPYERLAKDNALAWKTLDDVHAASARFLDPVLQGTSGHWDPEAWAWISQEAR